MINAQSPYKSMNDFVAADKKSPGTLKQAGGSVTAIESLTGLLLQSATSAKWTLCRRPQLKIVSPISYPATCIQYSQPQDVNDRIAAGRLRPIAALTEKRLTVLPQVPTIKEQGIGVPIIANARGILAPPGVARAVISYWEDFFARLTQTLQQAGVKLAQ